MKFSAERPEIGREEISKIVEKRFRFERREPIFEAFTMSPKPAFIMQCNEEGKDPYQEMKRLVDKLLSAFYELCRRCVYVYYIFLRIVKHDGLPHVHGVLFADCKAVKRELARLWSRYGLGYQEFKSSRERGNVLFKPITDLRGWLNYIFCKQRNKHGTERKRTSYHGGKMLQSKSPYDVERMFQNKGQLSTFLKYIRPDNKRARR